MKMEKKIIVGLFIVLNFNALQASSGRARAEWRTKQIQQYNDTLKALSPALQAKYYSLVKAWDTAYSNLPYDQKYGNKPTGPAFNKANLELRSFKQVHGLNLNLGY